MKYLDNIKSDKLTTGAGIAVLLVIVANAFGYNVSEQLGMDNGTIVLSIGAGISALLNLISTRKNKEYENKEKSKETK